MQLNDPDIASFNNISSLHTSSKGYLHVISFKQDSTLQKEQLIPQSLIIGICFTVLGAQLVLTERRRMHTQLRFNKLMIQQYGAQQIAAQKTAIASRVLFKGKIPQ